MNPYTNFEQFAGILDNDDMLERRYESDGNGNVIYIGWTTIVDASVDALVWYVQKTEYVGDIAVRSRLPLGGVGFKYAWSQRATYFS